MGLGGEGADTNKWALVVRLVMLAARTHTGRCEPYWYIGCARLQPAELIFPLLALVDLPQEQGRGASSVALAPSAPWERNKNINGGGCTWTTNEGYQRGWGCGNEGCQRGWGGTWTYQRGWR